ncbi:MAG TPA: hypothetical protein VGQ08_04350 [Nitrospiraceae bacterium]|jgi:hypothetical protein|nr:hypothetical protein [Nitrospiraceae bacterium]
MMLSSRSDEFGLVHERRDETGETDACRDGSQVRTTQHLHGKRLSRPNEHDHAGREDQALQSSQSWLKKNGVHVIDTRGA